MKAESRLWNIMYGICLCVFIIFQHRVASFPHQCKFDRRCQCGSEANQGPTKIECSGKNISAFPKFPSSSINITFAFNLVRVVKNKTFENVQNLEALDISFNRISHLERDAFVGLWKMKNLQIQGNQLKYDTFSFPNNVFKPLTLLQTLDIRFAKYTRVPTNFPGDVVKDLTSLQEIKLDVRSSANVRYPFGKGFTVLKNLRNLKAGKCYMNVAIFTVFSNVQHLQYVDMSSCRMQVTHCLFCDLNEIVYLDISNNMFSVLNMEDIIKGLNKKFSLRVLKMAGALKNNQDYQNFPLIIFDYLANTNISKLYLNKNNFVRLVGNKNDTLPSTLRHLDLSSNKLIHFNIAMPILFRLNLRNNSLGQFLSHHRLTTSTACFLKELDLSFNSIFDLSFSIFHTYPHLEDIDLSSNRLSEIKFDLSHFTVLRRLNLSNNRIGYLNDNTMHMLDNFTKQSNFVIDLSNNNLQCSCTKLSFLTWTLGHQGHFWNLDKYNCNFDNGTVISGDFRRYVLELQKDCASNTVLIVFVSLGFFLACVVVTSGLLYRNRWKLRYLYYSTKSKYQNIQQPGQDNSYKYNAFVSYSDTETKFIVKELIPNLEEKLGMKLCVHQRDFIPGQEININITNAIQESKKTICIITRSFLESYYCMFEFNMARMESIYSRNGQNILLLVFYEQMVSRELPLVMLELIHKQSYIEYPNDEHGNIVFWEKIRDAIN